MKKMIALILVVLICLIVSGILFFAFYTPKNNTVADVETNTVETTKEAEEELKDTVSYSPGTGIITNIKDSKRYLKIKVAMEIKNEKAKEHFAKNESKIKDIIINVLRNKTETELISPNSQEYLKIEIKDALGAKMDIKDLVDIFIEEFVIQ